MQTEAVVVVRRCDWNAMSHVGRERERGPDYRLSSQYPARRLFLLDVVLGIKDIFVVLLGARSFSSASCKSKVRQSIGISQGFLQIQIQCFVSNRDEVKACVSYSN